GGDDAHLFEGGEDPAGDGCVGAAGEDGTDDAAADECGGVANSVGAARAAGGQDVRRAAQPQGDRQFAGKVPVGAGGDGEQRAGAFGEEGAVLLLDERQPPAAGAQ